MQESMENPQPISKRCCLCRQEKDRSDFGRDKQRADGLDVRCRSCSKARHRAHYLKHTEARKAQTARYYAANRKTKIAAWRRSPKGIATALRNHHGFNNATAEYWSRILSNPSSRCSLCGIPLHKLRRMLSFKFGGQKLNNRLTIDHITCGINDGNYRVLCFSCNRTRGAAHYTDEEVLDIMREWYLWKYSARKLWWLNDRIEDGVGVGGRAERTPRMAAKIAELEANEDEGKQSTG